MKKILFISNITKKITNFSIPSITAAQQLGYEFHMAANLSNFADDETDYNVTLHHINLDRNPFSIKNFRAYREMLTLIKKERFDVIHCNTPIGGILGRLCGKRAKIKNVIYTAHGFHFYKGAPLKNNIIFKMAEKWMAQYTDAIITMNNEDFKEAQKLKLRRNGRAYYIPGVGVDTKLYQDNQVDKKRLKESLTIKEDDILLISMGDLIQRKNYEASIEAIAKTDNPKLHYLICGVGPKLESLQILAKNRGIEKQIHFLGFRTDIKELLAIADIFLFTTYQEGLPRSLMEAMATGLPCVVSNVRGNVDLINNNEGGYLLDPDDIGGIAKAINKLASNKELRRNMSARNLEEIKRYDVENIKKEMQKIYREVLLND
ncbi:glycosyltransferase family 4 protein [Lederbergia ruris]|uniref:glycosyltransferase family 4 protein n=1 Tax=Lederbergia ruris TaxID=217495 RepID=UPI0039A20DDB